MSRIWCAACLIGLALSGCRSQCTQWEHSPSDSYLPFVQQIEYPDVTSDESGIRPEDCVPPPSPRFSQETEKWPLTLEEAVSLALANSKVVRDLGAAIVASPMASTTIYDPAIVEADPRVGVEAALSAFDAQFATQLYMEQTDRAFNNFFFGGGANKLRNDTSNFRAGITKTAPTGTQFSLENLTAYTRNDVAINRFPSVYDSLISAGFRHPLLQGSGVEFNRIAGPMATPGNYNGVMIARIRTDISLADFEAAVRDFLRDVERAYWDLYFVYRDLDAKLEGRELALESWKIEEAKLRVGKGTASDEALARQQFYLAQAAVENALSGTLEGFGGVYAVERRLRGLLGLPAYDGRLILPADEPTRSDIRFEWFESVSSALARRVELRRQRWQIKHRELELLASRNFTRPQLDFIGQYRWRGFGDDLLGSTADPLGSAANSLFTGDLQEWMVGMEFTTPIGRRAGHAAVRHAELQHARDRAILDEMERRITLELRAAFTELDRAYLLCRSNYNMAVAAKIRLKTVQDRWKEGTDPFLFVIDAQREYVVAMSRYYQSTVDYNLALMNVHYARGTLLDNYQVYLAEGAWSAEAHASAARISQRFFEKSMNYCLTNPPAVSLGEYDQRSAEIAPEPQESPTPAANAPASPEGRTMPEPSRVDIAPEPQR